MGTCLHEFEACSPTDAFQTPRTYKSPGQQNKTSPLAKCTAPVGVDIMGAATAILLGARCRSLHHRLRAKGRRYDCKEEHHRDTNDTRLSQSESGHPSERIVLPRKRLQDGCMLISKSQMGFSRFARNREKTESLFSAHQRSRSRQSSELNDNSFFITHEVV